MLTANVNNRNSTIDVMKGIGIICVVIGHSSFTADSIVKFIYSWHMPLFFILSGYFYKECEISDRFRKDLRILMWPYIFAVISIAIVALVEKSLFNIDHLNHIVWGGLFGTPRALYNPDTFFGQGYIGALWFVPAIFMCRVIYNILPKGSLVRNLLIGGGGTSFLNILFNKIRTLTNVYFASIGRYRVLSYRCYVRKI